MPRFDDVQDDTQVQHTGGTYTFSAVNINDLGASEYTLATLVVDISGSVV